MIWFKFGDYEIPTKYIKDGSYNTKPKQIQDKDSYTDGNGLTHRNALPHTKSEVQFTLMKMSEIEMKKIISGIKRNIINVLERDGNCTYYDTWDGDLHTAHMYLDSSTEFKLIREQNGKRMYDETQILFVEY